MLAEPAIDPDYTSPWPQNTSSSRDYSVAGDTATVDLSRFVQVGADAETAAVQQLVYTVTANDKAVKKVRLLVQRQGAGSPGTATGRSRSHAPRCSTCRA